MRSCLSRLLFVLVSLLVWTAGCAIEIPYVDPGDATVTVIESQDADDWTFFDFDGGSQLLADDGTPLILDTPALASGGWDLAVSQFVLATATGPFQGGDGLSRGSLLLVDGDEDNPPSIADPDAQVSCSSLASQDWQIDEAADPDLAGPRHAVYHNVLLTSWFRYRLISHQAIPNFAVFALEDRFGRCLRLQVVDYYDDSGESGFVKVYWQYLQD